MKKMESINIKIHGYELDQMIIDYLKKKLGKNFKPLLMEFTEEKLENKYIYNDDDNEFNIYVEYKAIKK